MMLGLRRALIETSWSVFAMLHARILSALGTQGHDGTIPVCVGAPDVKCIVIRA